MPHVVASHRKKRGAGRMRGRHGGGAGPGGRGDQCLSATTFPSPSAHFTHIHHTGAPPPGPHGGSSKTITIIAFKCAVVRPPFDTVCRHGRSFEFHRVLRPKPWRHFRLRDARQTACFSSGRERGDCVVVVMAAYMYVHVCVNWFWEKNTRKILKKIPTTYIYRFDKINFF